MLVEGPDGDFGGMFGTHMDLSLVHSELIWEPISVKYEYLRLSSDNFKFHHTGFILKDLKGKASRVWSSHFWTDTRSHGNLQIDFLVGILWVTLQSPCDPSRSTCATGQRFKFHSVIICTKRCEARTCRLTRRMSSFAQKPSDAFLQGYHETEG